MYHASSKWKPNVYPVFVGWQILKFAQLESDEERIKVGKEIYDMYIMRELLSLSHVSHWVIAFVIYGF